MITHAKLFFRNLQQNALNQFLTIFFPKLFYKIQNWTFINVQKWKSEKSLGKKF